MPLIIPKDLPAYEELQQENVFVMHQERAMSQHIRPLRILILNLMPTKIVTETQLARACWPTALCRCRSPFCRRRPTATSPSTATRST